MYLQKILVHAQFSKKKKISVVIRNIEMRELTLRYYSKITFSKAWIVLILSIVGY